MTQATYTTVTSGNIYTYPGTTDIFSNVYVGTAGTAPINIGGGGGGGGSSASWAPIGGYISAPTAVTFNWNITPSRELLCEPEVLDKLISKMVTLYKPEDPLVICVDNDYTPEEIDRLAKQLTEYHLKGVIIPAARAGTGMPIYRPIKPEYERIDILARIGEVWERKPELSLTQLLSWWKGEHMEDDQFAAAVEVNFKKAFEDWTL